MNEYGRREFLGMSALGILGLARASRESAHAVDGELLYIGSYTEKGRTDGIHLVRMDRNTGDLRVVGAMNAGPNPSYLAVHPNGRTLYAVNETGEHNGKPTGGVSAFAIARDTGALTRVSDESSGGKGPCYVSLDRGGRVALVANYDGGSVAILPLDATGALRAATQIDQHQGKGPNAERQEAPHAHCIITDPSNRFALAADLGMDRVFVYRLDADAGALRHVEGGDGVLRPGAGPRHIAFHATLPLVFVVGELDSTVTTLRFDAERGVLTTLATRSTLPSGWSGTSYAADIHVAPLGKVLYVSNRGHNSIAVLSIASSGTLALEQTIPTEGDWPRNFTLDPTGRWLLVGNQNSGSVIVLARDERTGRLRRAGRKLAIPSPACLRFYSATAFSSSSSRERSYPRSAAASR